MYEIEYISYERRWARDAILKKPALSLSMAVEH
jgi:hypothetical protein